MTKTLKGKDNYLFLINDSSKSLKKHIDNTVNLPSPHIIKKKYNILNNPQTPFLIVFPDKEVICKDFLPDNIKINYRKHLESYKSVFGEKILDPTNILKPSDYYKTDTHINNKGALKVFKVFLNFLNRKFKVNLEYENIELHKIETDSLSKLNKCVGDLTWDINRQDTILNDISDIYYKFPPDIDFYMTTYMKNDQSFKILDYNFNDISDKHVNNVIDWNLVSDNIFYKKTDTFQINKKVVIFYDSFLLSSIGLYKNLFKEIYFIKNSFNSCLLKKINPDFVFEFRVERFLI